MQEININHDVFYLSATREKIGENFSFYNDNFYTDIDALDRPSNSDINTIKVDIPRVCLVTGKNEVTAQKISFIKENWLGLLWTHCQIELFIQLTRKYIF